MTLQEAIDHLKKLQSIADTAKLRTCLFYTFSPKDADALRMVLEAAEMLTLSRPIPDTLTTDRPIQ